MKTVIFGGTFNPIHVGHISMIKTAMKALEPDRFILMPTHIPPHKQAESLASDSVRLELCRLAVRDISGVEVSDYEQTLPGKSYTVNTLEYLHSVYPDDELYFLMGSDMLLSFLNWYRTDRILELASLCVISRQNGDRAILENSAEKIRQVGGRVVIIDCEPVEISSTEVRARIAAYGSSLGALPKPEEEYIMKNKLYNFDKSKYNNYIEFLKGRLSEKRFVHSLNVADESVHLACLNGIDPDRAYLAGLLHDVCKEIPKEEQLELLKRSRFPVTDVETEAPKTHHGIAGAVFAEEYFGIDDMEILSAIRYHTVSKGGMTLLEKAVYMADLISADRDYPDVEKIRSITYADIDMGMYEALKFSIGDSLSKTRAIPHLTLDAYNEAVRYKHQKEDKK